MFYLSLWPWITSSRWISLWLYRNMPTPLSFVGHCPPTSWLQRISVFLKYCKPYRCVVYLWQEMFSFTLTSFLSAKLVVIYSVSINLDSLVSFLIYRFHNPSCMRIRYCVQTWMACKTVISKVVRSGLLVLQIWSWKAFCILIISSPMCITIYWLILSPSVPHLHIHSHNLFTPRCILLSLFSYW